MRYLAGRPLLLALAALSCSEPSLPYTTGRLVTSRAELGRANLGDDSRFILPASDAKFDVRVPADAFLDVGFGVAPTVWGKGLEDVEFVVVFHDGPRDVGLFRRRITKADESKWHEARIPLAPIAERPGQIQLKVEGGSGGTLLPRTAFWTPPVVTRPESGDGLNFVLFSIDTLRRDRLGCYGNPRDTSPSIDRLAREGVLFRQAIAPSSWTLPSHASMFTGLQPMRHGAVRFDMHQVLNRNLDMLAELLWDAGYATAGYTGGAFVDPRFGFDQGFDRYSVVLQPRTVTKGDAARRFFTDLDRAVRLATEWIGNQNGRRFFLFLHTYQVHAPYFPPAPYNVMYDPDYEGRYAKRFGKGDYLKAERPLDARTLEHLLALYDGEIRYTDDVFGRFLSYLESSGLAERTCVIVTSDHGEEFQEHGDMFHDHARLYEELIAIPMVVRCPSGSPKGRVADRLVSLVDVLPTVLDLADLPIPPRLDGVSLKPTVLGSGEAGHDMTLSEVDGSVEDRKGNAVALRTDRYKLIRSTWDSTPKFFDLRVDPGEKRDLSAKHRELAADLVRKLDSVLAASEPTSGDVPATQSTDFDPALRERMRALGYVE